MRTSKINLVAAAIAVLGVMALLSGCATTAHIKSDITFQQRAKVIAEPVGLYVSQDTRDYVAIGNYSGFSYKVPLGESIEPNAMSSLEKVFKSVRVVDDLKVSGTEGDVPLRIFALEVEDSTQIHLGTFTFSSNEIVLDLLCKAYNRDGQTVWEKKIHTKAKKWSAWGLLGNIAGTHGYISSLRQAGEESLRLSLEELNDSILAEENVIFEEEASK